MKIPTDFTTDFPTDFYTDFAKKLKFFKIVPRLLEHVLISLTDSYNIYTTSFGLFVCLFCIKYEITYLYDTSEDSEKEFTPPLAHFSLPPTKKKFLNFLFNEILILSCKVCNLASWSPSF